jgi:protein-tyrosine-phosphatase
VDPDIGRHSPGRIRAVARDLGLDLDLHRSKTFAPAPPSASELFVVMDPANYAAVIARFPAAAEQILFLGMFCRRPTLTIHDPIDANEAKTREVAQQLNEAVARLLAWLDR